MPKWRDARITNLLVINGTAVPGSGTSYAAGHEATTHAKSYGQKFLSKRQPLTGTFKGAEPLGTYAGLAPKSEGAVCDDTLFTGVVGIPPGWLGPRHGAVTVDLLEPGQEPREHP